jgi:uncharacterized protein (UPF0335 family)
MPKREAVPMIGHNSSMTVDEKAALKAFAERIEHVNEEIAELNSDRKSIYQEAKTRGFSTKALRQVIRERAQDATERADYQAVLDSYRLSLGILVDLPLGQAALKRVAASA